MSGGGYVNCRTTSSRYECVERREPLRARCAGRLAPVYLRPEGKAHLFRVALGAGPSGTGLYRASRDGTRRAVSAHPGDDPMAQREREMLLATDVELANQFSVAV